jgi:peptidoglycan/LPS O-acetylase OafA/YrhL
MIAILVGWKALLWHEQAGAIVWGFGGWRNLAANMFYVQDILHTQGVPRMFKIVGVGWTLCLEVQFYLALIMLLALAAWAYRRWGRRAENTLLAIVLLPLTCCSLYRWFGVKSYDFIGMWFMFAAGAILWWTLERRVRGYWLWALLTLILAGGIWRSDGRALAAAATVIALYTAARSGGMHSWLGNRLIQYFGRISYSLYLCHVTIGGLLLFLFWQFGDRSRFLATIAYAAACIASVAFADLLHRFVEVPSIQLARRIKPIGVRRPASSPARDPVGNQTGTGKQPATDLVSRPC